MSDSRDKKLIALLPPKDSPYSFDNLSEAETVALEAAFGDGFGEVGVPDFHGADAESFEGSYEVPFSGLEIKPLPLPQEIRSGLLRHSFFVRGSSEYDHEEYPDEFWKVHDDEPAPFTRFPLGFVLRRLRLYFRNQMNRFCECLIREELDYASIDRDQLESLALYRLYKKPWYEFHAVQFIDWIESAQGNVVEKIRPRLAASLISSFSGELGRLVEQYYWRFRFEDVANTGIGARKGASAGGKAKARLHHAERSEWQRLASDIWGSRPRLSKIAVADIIKRRLGTMRTAKHIARLINRP